MKKKNDALNKDQIEEAHKFYSTTSSLKETATWISVTYGLNVNRHNLSRDFHRFNLYVSPPNGRSVESYELRTWGSNLNRLLGEHLSLLWSDISDYLKGKGSYTDYLTACYAVGDRYYEDVLNILNRSGETPIAPDRTPVGIKKEDVLSGKSRYEKLVKRWVYAGVDKFESSGNRSKPL